MYVEACSGDVTNYVTTLFVVSIVVKCYSIRSRKHHGILGLKEITDRGRNLGIQSLTQLVLRRILLGLLKFISEYLQ